MNNNCAVCWSEMGPPLPRAPLMLMGAGGAGLAALHTAPASAPGKSLPCGHAFHEACIKQWLMQCHGCGGAPCSLRAACVGHCPCACAFAAMLSLRTVCSCACPLHSLHA